MQHTVNTGINQFVTTTNHITTASTPILLTSASTPTPTLSYTFSADDRVPINPYVIKLKDNNMYNEFTVEYLRSIQGKNIGDLGFKITKVEMLAKNKVMRFTFNENNIFSCPKEKLVIIKTVCKPEDTFSIETACYVAIAKYISRGELTPEGISALADNLKFYKRANKIVAAAVKLYNKSVKEAEKAAALKEELKLVKERQRAKKIRYKERKRQKKTN